MYPLEHFRVLHCLTVYGRTLPFIFELELYCAEVVIPGHCRSTYHQLKMIPSCLDEPSDSSPVTPRCAKRSPPHSLGVPPHSPRAQAASRGGSARRRSRRRRSTLAHGARAGGGTGDGGGVLWAGQRGLLRQRSDLSKAIRTEVGSIGDPGCGVSAACRRKGVLGRRKDEVDIPMNMPRRDPTRTSCQ
jgi:hypothetical protein